MAGKAASTKPAISTNKAAGLPKEIFGVEVKSHRLLAEALRAYQAENRQVSATTKRRGEVRGGGKKPWRQKGTGRARAGSIRSPLWRGGGVIFGPSGQENYRLNLPLKAKRQALRQALSLRAADGVVKVVDDLAVKDGKTKELVDILKKLKLERSVLLVVDAKPDPLRRAAQNLKRVKLIEASYLNAFDVMRVDSILVTKPALKVISGWVSGVKSAKEAE